MILYKFMLYSKCNRILQNYFKELLIQKNIFLEI